MKKLKDAAITVVFTVLLILIAAFCISGTVFCRNKGGNQMEEQSWKVMEQEYVARLYSLLEEKGYCNSGVTMNRVIQADGSREYVVKIHHRRINRLDACGQAALLGECRKIAFPVEDCSFYHEFLETDS